MYPFPDAAIDLLTPPEPLSVSHWCDRYRRLDGRIGKKGGPWRTSYTPYLREPLDAVYFDNVLSVIFSKCSRIGGSEWLNNLLAYTADARPLPALYTQPQRDDVVEEMRGRLRGIFENSPRLRRLIPDDGEWATADGITLTSMDIMPAWATSPAKLVRRTIGLLILDEIDNIAAAATSLGNVWTLALERIATYGNYGRALAAGTPSTEYAQGRRALLASDYRRPYVPCPLCGHMQVLTLGNIIIPEDVRDPERIVREKLGRYRCESCGELLDHDEHHTDMIARTVWVPRTSEKDDDGNPTWPEVGPMPTKGRVWEIDSLAVPPYDPFSPEYAAHEQWTPEISGETYQTGHRGYWINTLYSPLETRTWSHIVAKQLACRENREDLRVFVNAWLGEPWRERVRTPDWEAVGRRRAEGPREDRVPTDAKVLICGADVQADRIEYAVWAFGPYFTSYLIRHGVTTSFDALYNIAFYTGYHVTNDRTNLTPDQLANLPRMHCRLIGIDAGYAARLAEVQAFAKREGVVAVRGRASSQMARITARRSEAWRPTKGNPDEFQLNVDLFKGQVIQAFNIPSSEAGALHLHQTTTDDFCRQLTAEVPVYVTGKTGRKKGRREIEWHVQEGRANEGLDTCVYSYALADMLDCRDWRAETPFISPVVYPERHPDGPKPAPKRPARRRARRDVFSGPPGD
ncbi:MAG: terminase gpA endonuclease subunit [Planctomycetota bacterium]